MHDPNGDNPQPETADQQSQKLAGQQGPDPVVQVAPEIVPEGEASVAPEGAQNPTAAEQTAQGKSIFLFSDGTGNSSAKLFKTNVWRMYEALDLGHARPGQCVQIAYYDNGVGTSNFRPLALLGGIFGIGLKTNVLRIYQFLCRNYQPNDRIYAFGFSRGAFTIRLLVSLIASQGVIRHPDPPMYWMRDAYRRECKDVKPNRWPAWLAKLVKGIRDILIWTKRRILFQRSCPDELREHPNIEFVGVWDTVAAYGGPFAEVTRGVDDWVWPLTMPNYALSPKVNKARHALSLDDERDAFQPLLWDEFHEQHLVAEGKAKPDRLKQVWFSGVHSDVGGGYPDESLSYNSLLWMMDELGRDVRFLPRFAAHARALANPFGPIHDSRSGLGAYYRYQPRKLAAMMDPALSKHMALRDPEIGRVPDFGRDWDQERKARWKKHGLLVKAQIHETAFARIMSGIDSYAPAALPENFEVVPVQGPRARASLKAQDYQLLSAVRPLEPRRVDRQERAWNKVWWRRLTYFATAGLSLHLIFLPWLPWLDWIDALCSDDRCFARTLLEKPAFLLPAFVRELWAYYLLKPFALIVGLVLLGAMLGIGEMFERRFRGKVRNIWRDTLDGKTGLQTAEAFASFHHRKPRWAGLLLLRSARFPRLFATVIRRFRESFAYQWVVYLFKWRLLPLIFGISILAILLYLAALAATQIFYAFAEPRQAFCTNRTQDEGRVSTSGPVAFLAASPCTDLKVNVKKDHIYRVHLTEVADWEDGGNPDAFPWLDQGIPASPDRGITEQTRVTKLAWPFNRVTSANFYKPLTEVRTHNLQGWAKLREWILGPDIDVHAIEFKRQGDDYRGHLCPERDGHLYMMLNDAGFAYANNRGSAKVEVELLGPVEQGRTCPGHEVKP